MNNLEFIDTTILNAERMELFALLRADDIDESIVRAMEAIPRELFMPPEAFNFAYVDKPFPLPGLDGYASISQPWVVAKMLTYLNVQPTDVVMEIGTATGYQAAVLAHLAHRVITIESVDALALEAKEKIEALGITNVDIIIGDGSTEVIEPYSIDKLIVTASVPPQLVTPLFEFVKPGGCIVVPVGGVHGDLNRCLVMKMKKCSEGYEVEEVGFDYYFVPLLGQNGWGTWINKLMTKQYDQFLDDLFFGTNF